MPQTRAHRLRPSRRALGLVGVLACSADSPTLTRAHRLRPSQRARPRRRPRVLGGLALPDARSSAAAVLTRARPRRRSRASDERLLLACSAATASFEACGAAVASSSSASLARRSSKLPAQLNFMVVSGRERETFEWSGAPHGRIRRGIRLDRYFSDLMRRLSYRGAMQPHQS
jgi:hypothetical protein